MPKIFIKPKQDCIVRDPVSKIPLDAKGQTVVENTFWRRRIKAGDVTVITGKPAKLSAQESFSKQKD